MRFNHAFTPKISVSYHISYHIYEDSGFVVHEINWGHITFVCPEIWLPFSKKNLVSSIIFEILFYVAATTKYIFLCKKWYKIGAPLSSPKVLQ